MGFHIHRQCPGAQPQLVSRGTGSDGNVYSGDRAVNRPRNGREQPSRPKIICRDSSVAPDNLRADHDVTSPQVGAQPARETIADDTPATLCRRAAYDIGKIRSIQSIDLPFKLPLSDV